MRPLRPTPRRVAGARARLAVVAATTGTLLLAPPSARAQGAAGAAPPVQMGLTVQPETVTVGQPFVVRLRVRAPAGATIAFPAAPDTDAAVEPLDPRALGANADPAAADQTATYRLAAWDVGDQPLRLGDVVVRVGGAERRLPLGAAKVHVASVLPADSAQRVPKPARAIFEPAPPWWWPWLPILLAVALLLLLLWWWWRRRRRRGPAADEVSAIEYAEREFARVEALGLVEAGERGRFVALMVDVLRDYLARRLPDADVSRTSTELLAGLRLGPSRRAVPLDRLAPLLAEADLIKFARRPVTAERATALGGEARAIVRDVERDVERARAEEEAAAAAAADAAAAAAREVERTETAA
jgi:hypothetical protein